MISGLSVCSIFLRFVLKILPHSSLCCGVSLLVQYLPLKLYGLFRNVNCYVCEILLLQIFYSAYDLAKVIEILEGLECFLLFSVIFQDITYH